MTFPIVGSFLFFAFRLIAMAVISLWIGVPTALNNIANEWLDRAVIAGFPTQWDRQLYYIFWCLGFVAVVIGWVLFSFITVWIFHLIF
jgi:hypothetical protein